MTADKLGQLEEGIQELELWHSCRRTKGPVLVRAVLPSSE